MNVTPEKSDGTSRLGKECCTAAISAEETSDLLGEMGGHKIRSLRSDSLLCTLVPRQSSPASTRDAPKSSTRLRARGSVGSAANSNSCNR